ADAIRRQEARHEDVRVRQVKLPAPRVGADGGDAAETAAPVVEDGSEDAGRVEVGQAEPVDRAVEPDEGRGVEVADDRVVLDGQIAHVRAASGRYSSTTGKSFRSRAIAASRNRSTQR